MRTDAMRIPQTTSLFIKDFDIVFSDFGFVQFCFENLSSNLPFRWFKITVFFLSATYEIGAGSFFIYELRTLKTINVCIKN